MSINLAPGVGRSYNLMTISRTTGQVTVYRRYDVFGNTPQLGALEANELADQLNTFDDSVIVIIFTYDEPERNSSILIAALQRCGASLDYNSRLKARSAYILVGIPGIVTGITLEERYEGDATSGGDPDAWIDLRISVINGQYTYISG